MARVRVVQLASAQGLPLPEYQTKGAAGLDLVAAFSADETETIAPGGRALIPTGLQIELPKGYEAQVRPRSGLALKHGVTVLNSPGTIDCDYRGEVKIILINLGAEPFVVNRGERVAQLVIAPVVQAKLVAAAALSATARGDGGFGSTRLKAEAKKKISAGRGSLKPKTLAGRTSGSKRPGKRK